MAMWLDYKPTRYEGKGFLRNLNLRIHRDITGEMWFGVWQGVMKERNNSNHQAVSFHGANWTDIVDGVVPAHATNAEVHDPRSLRTIISLITRPNVYLLITKDWVYAQVSILLVCLQQ